MRCDIIHAVKKLAKFSRKPGKNDFKAICFMFLDTYMTIIVWESDFTE
jgi:hypothetical protein